MNAEKKKRHADRLSSRLGELRERLSEIHRELDGQRAHRPSNPIDQGQANELRATLRREQQIVEREIRRHVRAINNLDDLGICEQCGDDIPEKRLEIDPTISTCVPCQSTRE